MTRDATSSVSWLGGMHVRQAARFHWTSEDDYLLSHGSQQGIGIDLASKVAASAGPNSTLALDGVICPNWSGVVTRSDNHDTPGGRLAGTRSAHVLGVWLEKRQVTGGGTAKKPHLRPPGPDSDL